MTLLHTADGMADQFIKDVTNSVTEIMKNPGKPVEGQVLMNNKIACILLNDFIHIQKFYLRFSAGILWCRTESIRSFARG